MWIPMAHTSSVRNLLHCLPLLFRKFSTKGTESLENTLAVTIIYSKGIFSSNCENIYFLQPFSLLAIVSFKAKIVGVLHKLPRNLGYRFPLSYMVQPSASSF